VVSLVSITTLTHLILEQNVFLLVRTRVFSCRACDWDGCPDCRAEAQSSIQK
jgi:hypothetical protein